MVSGMDSAPESRRYHDDDGAADGTARSDGGTRPRHNKRWRDLTTTQKAGIVLLSTVQITLLVAALTDLRRRSADEINGSKQLWTALAFVNKYHRPHGLFRRWTQAVAT